MSSARRDDGMNDDTRLALLEQSHKNIESSLIRIEKKFDKIDERFNGLDKRFDRIEDKFDSVNSRIDGWTKWLIGIGIASFGAMSGAIFDIVLKLHSA